MNQDLNSNLNDTTLAERSKELNPQSTRASRASGVKVKEVNSKLFLPGANTVVVASRPNFEAEMIVSPSMKFLGE